MPHIAVRVAASLLIGATASLVIAWTTGNLWPGLNRGRFGAHAALPPPESLASTSVKFQRGIFRDTMMYYIDYGMIHYDDSRITPTPEQLRLAHEQRRKKKEAQNAYWETKPLFGDFEFKPYPEDAGPLPRWIDRIPIERGHFLLDGTWIAMGWPLRSVKGYHSRFTSFSDDHSLIPLHTPAKGHAYALPYGIIWPGYALNTVLYGAFFFCSFRVIEVVKRTRRIRRGRCTACGYDLNGEPGCPECGLGMGAEP